MKLLNKKNVAKLLDCTPSAVEKLMKTWKVPTTYLGPGRGLGYRWREEDVLAALYKRQVSTDKKRKPKRKKTKSLFDMSTKDQIEYLTKNKK